MKRKSYQRERERERVGNYNHIPKRGWYKHIRNYFDNAKYILCIEIDYYKNNTLYSYYSDSGNV